MWDSAAAATNRHSNCCDSCANYTSSAPPENGTTDAIGDMDIHVDFHSRVAFGIIFVTLTSLSSLGGAVILPLLHRRIYSYAMVWLVGVAVGTLAGRSIPFSGGHKNCNTFFCMNFSRICIN